MKKQLLFLITVLFAFTALNAQTVVFEDDFESYADGYNLTGAGYTVWEGTAKVVDVTVQTELTAFNGNKFGQSDAGKNNFAFRKDLTLEAGKSYTWEIATKIQDGIKYFLQIQPVDTYQKVELTNSDWVKQSVQFTVLEGSENVTLAVYRYGLKAVSFDDFKLIKEAGTSLSDDASLSALSISAGTLTPDFATGTTSYTATLPAGTVNPPTATPTTTDAAASFVVNDATDVTSSTAADRTTTIVVTAEDGDTELTYSIEFTVAEPLNDDASLSALSISAGTLTPVFATGTTSYTATLPAGTVNPPTATPTTTDAAASFVVNDATDVNSTATADRTTTIVVTAEDGDTELTYSILFDVEVNTALNNIKTNHFEAYPNPANDFLSIKNANDIKTIEIISLTGQTVRHINYFSPNQQLDISDLHKGYYFLKITSKDLEVHSTRLIVE